jgi:predicted secreted acid phosphatase
MSAAMRPAVAVSLLAAALSLAACKPTSLTAPSGAAAKPATATAAKPATGDVGANDNLNAVLWVQRAAEYEAVTQTVYRAAADQLDAALKQPNWDALVPGERGNAATGLPPAVVMDVDETVLDNSPYQARLVHDGGATTKPPGTCGSPRRRPSRCPAWSISPRPRPRRA